MLSRAVLYEFVAKGEQSIIYLVHVAMVTGRIQTHHVGGGHRQRYRMVDFKKEGPKEGAPRQERVMLVRYDPCRTADIAVVAGGEHQRYIIASDGMKAGDIVKTSCNIPLTPGKLTRKLEM
jgi:large subunit ribosomal protein L2